MVHGGPWAPLEGLQIINDIRHVGYQFYSVFSTENESRVDTYLRFQIRLPQGGPWGSRVPLGRSPKYLINTRHVGYQFYSVFSAENKSCVDTSLRFQISLQQGDPWGSLGPLGGVSKEPNIIRWPYVRAKMLLRGHII